MVAREASRRTTATAEAGLTIIEVLVAATLALIAVLAAYDLIDDSRRIYVLQSDTSEANSIGRTVIDFLSDELRVAGYSPTGVAFDAIPSGDANRLRFMQDADRDGTVGGAEANEDVTYLFSPGAGDEWKLYRGVDLDGNGVFDELLGESSDLLSALIVPVDINGDGVNEPFLAYDVAPPGTTQVTINFGVRARHRDAQRHRYPVLPFRSVVALKNVS